MWNVKTKVITLIIVATVTISKSFTKYLRNIYTEYTQKNGAVYYVFSMETTPFFCVYPVYMESTTSRNYRTQPYWALHM
jgi:hypothetical protein